MFPDVPPEVADANRIAFASSELPDWIAQAGSSTLRGETCEFEQTLLSVELFNQARMLPDEIVGELILNADAAMRSMVVLCDEANVEGATIEHDDLKRTLGLIEQRLEMLDR